MMPDSQVSSCVLNILGSFSSSLGLYKRLKEKRKRLRRVGRNEKPDSEEELRLTRSLRQGPEDISREYQNSFSSAGDRFAVGDAIAQTSLAEVLLRLNVGLVGIITSFLSTEERSRVQLDYKSLADLAEGSRIDTCRALRSLLKRLTTFNRSVPRAISSKAQIGTRPANVKAASTSNVSSNRSRNTNTSAKTRSKIRGPTLAQVVIQDSSKRPQLAIVRPGERRKKSRASPIDSTTSRTRQDSAVAISPIPAFDAPRQDIRQLTERTKTSSDLRKPHRKQPTPNVTAAAEEPSGNGKPVRASKSTPRLQSFPSEPFEAPPPMPTMPNMAPQPAIEASTRPSPAAMSTPALIPRRRKPTPTYYSIATDSTKLGEIPLHKWAQPYDFDRMELLNREAYRDGWPNVPDEVGNESRRRRGFWGLFRRRSD